MKVKIVRLLKVDTIRSWMAEWVESYLVGWQSIKKDILKNSCLADKMLEHRIGLIYFLQIWLSDFCSFNISSTLNTP